jgi:general stress protein YciG
MIDDKNKRGFASMDADTRRQIASAGGKAVHSQGKGHEFTPEEARRAGRKGGAVVARDVAHMAEIGRRGGLARQRGSNGRRAQDAD